MPTVHVSKPSSSSSHSKSYSHSNSQSTHSYTNSHTYSHSHAYSLSTSSSSKSSRNPHHRGHSRNESWGKTALMKAGAICGVGQTDHHSMAVDEKALSSSRADEPLGDPSGGERALDDAHVDREVSSSPTVPSGEVGIAISSTPTPDDDALPIPNMEGLSMRDHPYTRDPSYPRSRGGGQDTQEETRDTLKRTHKYSEYAGPHLSTFDPNLPPRTASSDVSMRHRLPPRATAHLGAIAHPYGSAQTRKQAGKGGQRAALRVPGAGVSESSAGCAFSPHISLTNTEFVRYGVGEALVYASYPRPDGSIRTRDGDVQQVLSPVVEPPFCMDKGKAKEQFQSRDTVDQPVEETSGASHELVSNDPPSMSASTATVVMPVFGSTDDLDEFQDLFYKPPPRSSCGNENQEPSVTSKQIPTDVHSSESESALTTLVRSLGEEMNELRDPSRTPSGSTCPQRSLNHADQTWSDSAPEYVSLDLSRSDSSSPSPVESSAQMCSPIQQEGKPPVQLSTDVPEYVISSPASSVLETPSENENDTFGYPIRHGLVEAVAPFPVHSPRRASTHLSVVAGIEEQADVLSPVTICGGSTLSSAEAVRASYLTTTSDNSRMSGLSDFPLPPTAHPTSILQAYSKATPPSPEFQNYDTTTPAQPEPLPVPWVASRVTSYESHRTTFGGSDDIDFISEVHGATP
ncbi:hypothetical protein BS17DRAFT_557425 [Gyrodon lividus]|nr:hypothetical protein BS17DRAFT_557425 [Gyrodon lividus]